MIHGDEWSNRERMNNYEMIIRVLTKYLNFRAYVFSSCNDKVRVFVVRGTIDGIRRRLIRLPRGKAYSLTRKSVALTNDGNQPQ